MSEEQMYGVKSPPSPNRPLQHVEGDFLQVIQKLIQSLGVFPDPMARKKAYIAPVLKHHEYNLEKRWYIDFSVFSDVEQKMIRKRKWVKHHDTVDKRRADAEQIIYFLETALKDGLITPDPPKKSKLKTVSIDVLINRVLEVKQEQTRDTSMVSYQSCFNAFRKYWHHKGGLEDVSLLKTVDILEYLNHRQVVEKIGNGTRNNNLGYLKTLFNMAMGLELIPHNPCDNIPKLQVKLQKNRVYTQDEKRLLWERYQETYPDLLLFAAFIYYGFMRPRREIRFMRVAHINMTDRMILIPAENAKNKRARYVKMTSTLCQIIDKLEVMKCNPEFYVFGNERVPGITPYSKNVMGDRHAKIAKALGIGGTLYNNKHTGVYWAWTQGLTMKEISVQCGHSDLNETDRYFKQNGFYDRDRTFEFV